MCKKLIYLTLISAVLVLAENTTADMVACYPMDEGEGIDVADDTGNGNNGTINGTPEWVESMPGYSKALKFPGEEGNYIETGTWDPSEGTGQVSVTAWINWAGGTDTYQGILSKTDGVFNRMRWQLTLNIDDFRIGFGGGAGAPTYIADTPPVGQWQHVAFSHNGTTVTIYVNGVRIGSADIPLGDGVDAPLNIGTLSLFGIGDAVFNGIIDDVKIFNNAISEAEVQQAMLATSKVQAFSPKPKNNAVDVLYDVTLSWKPGAFADTHNVYLGTDFEEVDNADLSSPLLVGPSLTTNSFARRLEFGQTYFWRVDEVNTPPDNTVFKGDVWSFTVEPIAYPIPGANIIPTASGSEPGQGPEKTIDGSGLDENGLHSMISADMWLSSVGDPGSAWIQYEFDKPYKLHEMLIWNYNGNTVLSLYGIKEVTIKYSADGVTWTQANISELAQAPGTPGYAANTTVPFDDAEVKYVKVTANNNFVGGASPFNKYGLSEVKFMYIPVSARNPVPANEATGVAIDTSLSWRPGREAAQHQVYLDTDRQAVIDNTAFVATVDQPVNGPFSLDLSTIYYWRIDEVNNAEIVTTWPGSIWSFTTQEYLVVDDFESYNDIHTGEEGSNLVYETWIDGYNNPSTNGSTIGYASGASMETVTVHGGKQSVPLSYDNTSASLSEVTVDPGKLPIGRNWSKGSPQAFILWIYGDPNNTDNDQLYVKVGNSKFPYNGNLTQPQWEPVIVDLTGVNLNNVSSLTIGIERTGGAGGLGTVLIDDIRLYGTIPTAEDI
jgi:hypothetical protein